MIAAFERMRGMSNWEKGWFSKFNSKCMQCKKSCKQSAKADIINCPSFEAIISDKEARKNTSFKGLVQFPDGKVKESKIFKYFWFDGFGFCKKGVYFELKRTEINEKEIWKVGKEIRKR